MNKTNEDNVKNEIIETIAKHFKVYMAYEEDLREAKKSQKETISECLRNLNGILNKKDVNKIFKYLKRGITRDELVEDANLISDITKKLKNNNYDENLDI